jgi:hypothetical protein
MKSAKELGITKTQRRNLARLAVRFRDLKPNGYKGKFDMSVYCTPKHEGNVSPKQSIALFTKCGTSGCLLGHAPYLGIGLNSFGKNNDAKHMWNSFCTETFGLCYGVRWDWLFEDTWKSSKPHALKRIAWALEKGFPEEDDFYPYKGRTPKGFKSFEPNWEEIEKAAK